MEPCVDGTMPYVAGQGFGVIHDKIFPMSRWRERAVVSGAERRGDAEQADSEVAIDGFARPAAGIRA
jgi:hypothetical protein